MQLILDSCTDSQSYQKSSSIMADIKVNKDSEANHTAPSNSKGCGEKKFSLPTRTNEISVTDKHENKDVLDNGSKCRNISLHFVQDSNQERLQSDISTHDKGSHDLKNIEDSDPSNGLIAVSQSGLEKMPLPNDVMVVIADPTFETGPKGDDAPNSETSDSKDEMVEIINNTLNSLNQKNNSMDTYNKGNHTTEKNTIVDIESNNKIPQKPDLMVNKQPFNLNTKTTGNNSNDTAITDPKNMDILTLIEVESDSNEGMSKEVSKSLPQNHIDTFDIESDEEANLIKEPEKILDIKKNNPKTCVSLIDDDDDIVLVDEDCHTKINENMNINQTLISLLESAPKNSANVDPSISTNISNAALNKGILVEKDNLPGEPQKDQQPLPLNFLNSFRTSLGEMTRGDLEEFCLLKLVEAISGRSNLSDVKLKIKVLERSMDEWRKKVINLTKQNRDLQIVVTTVNEEQKKTLKDIPIPIKITRSVGLQVGYPSTSLKKNSEMQSQAEPLSPQTAASYTQSQEPPPLTSRKGRGKANTPIANANKPGPQKKMTSLPIPRLVPTVPSPPKGSLQNTSSNMGNISTNIVSSPILETALNNSSADSRRPSAEKRSAIQSIDLTDDEPPAKQPSLRNVSTPKPQSGLRLVPQPKLTNNTNTRMTYALNSPAGMSPRQVYIPISSQNTATVNVRKLTPVLRNPTQIRPIYPNPQLRIGQPIPIRATKHNVHPAPLPVPPITSHQIQTDGKFIPPRPSLKISKVNNGIVISWEMEDFSESRHEEVASYQIYAYQETTALPSTELWKKIGDVKALPLPMACTLTHFMAGYKYYFAVRALDVRSRLGPFSAPGNILLVHKK